MKFLVTVNMPSNQGKPVHQITCEIDGVSTLQMFHKLLHSQDYLLVSEYYYDAEARSHNVPMYKLRGRIILNSSVIAKVRELEER